MINNYVQQFTDLDPEELAYLQILTKDLSEDEIKTFVSVYGSRRKGSQTILLTCLLGFIGVAGIHRFILDQIGMGILYLLTGGLCCIGTIVDLINYKRLTFEYNQKQALASMMMVKPGQIPIQPGFSA